MYAMETSLPMTTVFIEDVDQATLENLKSDVLTRSGRVESLRLYTLGYIARGDEFSHITNADLISQSVSGIYSCISRTGCSLWLCQTHSSVQFSLLLLLEEHRADTSV